MPTNQLNLDNFMSQIPVINEVLDTARNELASAVPVIEAINANKTAVYTKGAEFTKEVKQQEGSAALATQQQVRDIASNIGTGDNSKLLSDLAQSFTDNLEKANKKRDEITTAKVEGAHSILKDITNIFTLPSKIDEYNTYADNANAALTTINEMNSATITAATAKQVQQQNLTEQVVADKAQLAADAFTIQADDAKLHGIINKVELQTKIATLADAQLTNLAKGVQLEDSLQNRALERQRLQLMIDAKNDTDESQKMMLTMYNTGAKALGLSPIAGFAQWKASASLGGAVKTKIDAVTNYGGSILLHATRTAEDGTVVSGDGSASMGASAGEAMVSSKFAQARPNGANTRAFDFRDAVLSTVSGLHPGEAVKPEVYSTEAQQVIVGEAKKYATNIELTDFHKNPYYQPGISVVAQLTPQLATTPEFIAVFGTLQASGQEVPVAGVVMESALAAVKKTPASINEVAKMIAKYYNAAVYHNANFGGVNQFALPKVEGYNVQLPTVMGGAFPIDNNAIVKKLLGHTQVDLTNAEQIRQYLLRSYKLFPTERK